MATSFKDSIKDLREQLDQLTEQLARLQTLNNNDNDPQITYRRPPTVFYPSEAEAARYPPIKPDDPLFFFKHDVPDEKIIEQFRDYPKNHAVGYDPPKLPTSIPCSPSQRAHDAQLRSIQRWLAHLTRPVDLFLHQVWLLENKQKLNTAEMVNFCSSFAIFMREQLAAISGRINTIRVDNIRSTHGASFKQSDPFVMADTQEFQDGLIVTNSSSQSNQFNGSKKQSFQSTESTPRQEKLGSKP
ncbi:hypothetical protein BGZ98_005034, partial [Dissophora globulifera]